jgi:23S rRNA (pseudouridine1915-N3)-methyltransferase
MKLTIIAVGKKMPAWVQTGYADYEKRLPKEWKPNVIELELAHRSKTKSTEQCKQQEAKDILANISRTDWVVVLDVMGKALSTEKLSSEMTKWQMDARNVTIVIGGPDGLDHSCLERANQKLSLSALTLPHPLVRVFLIEQLYRGWTIMHNHPYHK